MAGRKITNGAPLAAKKPRAKRGALHTLTGMPEAWGTVARKIHDLGAEQGQPKLWTDSFLEIANLILRAASEPSGARNIKMTEAARLFYEYTVACKAAARAVDQIVGEERSRVYRKLRKSDSPVAQDRANRYRAMLKDGLTDDQARKLIEAKDGVTLSAVDQSLRTGGIEIDRTKNRGRKRRS